MNPLNRSALDRDATRNLLETAVNNRLGPRPHVPNERLRHMLIGYARVSKADGPSRWTCSATRCGQRASTPSTSTTTSRPASATTGLDSTAVCARSGRAMCSSSGGDDGDVLPCERPRFARAAVLARAQHDQRAANKLDALQRAHPGVDDGPLHGSKGREGIAGVVPGLRRAAADQPDDVVMHHEPPQYVRGVGLLATLPADHSRPLNCAGAPQQQGSLLASYGVLLGGGAALECPVPQRC